MQIEETSAWELNVGPTRNKETYNKDATNGALLALLLGAIGRFGPGLLASLLGAFLPLGTRSCHGLSDGILP